MWVFALWVALAVAVGMLAAKRGRSGGGWFLLSLLVSPLLGVIFLIVSKDLSKDDGLRVACPKCSEKILVTASVCPHCRSNIADDANFAEAVAALKRKPKEDSNNLMIGIGFIVALFVIAKVIDSF